jgi:hypothetical protein
VAHSAQANSDPFSGHIPARLRPLGLPAEHTAWADSDPSVQSHHMTLTTATPPGPGYIPPARVHAPAGQAQSSKSPNLRTQQATEGVHRGYYDKAYVGARPKLSDMYVVGPARPQVCGHVAVRCRWGLNPAGPQTGRHCVPNSNRHCVRLSPCATAQPSDYVLVIGSSRKSDSIQDQSDQGQEKPCCRLSPTKHPQNQMFLAYLCDLRFASTVYCSSLGQQRPGVTPHDLAQVSKIFCLAYFFNDLNSSKFI